MVNNPNNFQSIIGGMIRGLTNSRRSAALTAHNVSNDNPQSFAWIGGSTSDLRQPIEKEMSQQPSLAFGKASSGTSYAYFNPVLNDIPSLYLQGQPGTNVSERKVAGSVGSPTNVPAPFAPIDNWPSAGYGMSPQNGDHFKYYFANQIGLSNQLPKPNPANVAEMTMAAQNHSAAGASDLWFSHAQTVSNMLKGYNPSGNYRGRYLPTNA